MEIQKAAFVYFFVMQISLRMKEGGMGGEPLLFEINLNPS